VSISSSTKCHRQRDPTAQNPAEHLYPPKANSALHRNDDGEVGIRDLPQKRLPRTWEGCSRTNDKGDGKEVRGRQERKERKKTLSYVPPPPLRLILSRARCSISSPVLTRYLRSLRCFCWLPPALTDNVRRYIVPDIV